MAHYDLVIIGAGPGGYEAAELAAHRGLKVALIEKNKLGGTCLNEGCIPTKALLAAAHLSEKSHEAQKYGLSGESHLEVDLKKTVQRKNKVVRKLTLGIKKGLEEAGVTLLTAEAQLLGKEGDLFLIQAGEEQLTAQHLIIATGSEAIVPPIPGIETVSCWTSREALDNTERFDSLLIVGGGVIGMEFANFFHALGVEVTVVEMAPKLLGMMDGALASGLQQSVEKKKIKVLLSTRLLRFEEGVAILEQEDGSTTTLKPSKVLFSVGRRAYSRGLGLERIGLEALPNGAIETNLRLETKVANCYAIGDVNGRSMLAHTASREGAVALSNILGEAQEIDYNLIPGVVYTDPEIASIGKTQEELEAAGTSYRLVELPMSYSGRFVIENELVQGLCKLLVGEDDRLLGVHLLGNGASEIIAIASVAMQRGLSLKEFVEVVFPHPTVGEILKLTALKALH